MEQYVSNSQDSNPQIAEQTAVSLNDGLPLTSLRFQEFQREKSYIVLRVSRDSDSYFDGI